MGLRACTFSALRTFRIRSMIMLLMQVNLHNVEIRRRVIMPKIAVSLRLEPEFVSLLKKIDTFHPSVNISFERNRVAATLLNPFLVHRAGFLLFEELTCCKPFL